MKLLLDISKFSIVKVDEITRHPYNTSVYPGYFLRSFKGYWYRMDVGGGRLKRMKYVAQHKTLESLYQEVSNGECYSQEKSRESIHGKV